MIITKINIKRAEAAGLFNSMQNAFKSIDYRIFARRRGADRKPVPEPVASHSRAKTIQQYVKKVSLKKEADYCRAANII